MTDTESAKMPGDENAGWRAATQELTTSAVEVAAIAEELERNRKENLAIRREHIMTMLMASDSAGFDLDDITALRSAADAIMEAAK